MNKTLKKGILVVQGGALLSQQGNQLDEDM